MESLSSLEMAFEKTACVECLYFYRYKGGSGDFMEIPVITERQWKLDTETGGGVEFFRARALAPKGGKHFQNNANSVSVTVCHKRKRVRFGPLGNIIMIQKGVGLGSALMSHVIETLQNTGYGDYRVEPGELSGADGFDPDKRLRRNRFYLRIGFELVSTTGMGEVGLDVAKGKFSADTVGALTPCLRPDTSLCDWSTSQTYSFQNKIAGATAKRRLAEVQDWYRNRLGGWGRMVANRLRIPIR